MLVLSPLGTARAAAAAPEETVPAQLPTAPDASPLAGAPLPPTFPNDDAFGAAEWRRVQRALPLDRIPGDARQRIQNERARFVNAERARRAGAVHAGPAGPSATGQASASTVAAATNPPFTTWSTIGPSPEG